MSNRPAAAPDLCLRHLPRRRCFRHIPQGAAPAWRVPPAPEAQEDVIVDQTCIVDQACSPAEHAAAIAAFKNGASVNAVAGLLGKTPGSVEWLLKKSGAGT
jgi:hypothetical protein